MIFSLIGVVDYFTEILKLFILIEKIQKFLCFIIYHNLDEAILRKNNKTRKKRNALQLLIHTTIDNIYKFA